MFKKLYEWKIQRIRSNLNISLIFEINGKDYLKKEYLHWL